MTPNRASRITVSRATRRRWSGRRVSRHRHEARARRSHQGPAGNLRQRPRPPHPLAREAQVLASLNHPNIAAIYGVEQNAIVMEFVDGEDLRGPVPVDTALAYARQIAAAHRQSTHRRPRVRARQRHRPSRSQAREPETHSRLPTEGARFRFGKSHRRRHSEARRQDQLPDHHHARHHGRRHHGHRGVHVPRASASSQEPAGPSAITPDGKTLLMVSLPVRVSALPLTPGDRRPAPVLSEPAGSARFSPDGRWLLYHTSSARPRVLRRTVIPDRAARFRSRRTAGRTRDCEATGRRCSTFRPKVT